MRKNCYLPRPLPCCKQFTNSDHHRPTVQTDKCEHRGGVSKLGWLPKETQELPMQLSCTGNTPVCVFIWTFCGCKPVSSWSLGKYTHLPPAKPAWLSKKVYFWTFLSSVSLQEVLIICVYTASTYPEWNLHRIKSIGVLFWIYTGPSCGAKGQKRPCCKPGPSYELLNRPCNTLGKSHLLLRDRGWRRRLPFPFLPSSLQPYRGLNQDVHTSLSFPPCPFSELLSR